jgi:hypothetical protein
MSWLAVLLACAAPPPDLAWELALHGQPVGIVRARRTADGWVRERLVRVDADGSTHERRTVVTWGADGGWRVDRPEGTSSGPGPAFDAWTRLPPASGVHPLLDESVGGVVQRAVARAGTALSWDTPAGPASIVVEEGVASSGTWAGTSFRRVAPDAPDPAPLDVAAVLSRPAPAFPRDRGALVSVWTVDGAELRVDVPLPDELPAWTAEVGALARRVAAEVPDAAAPFGGEGAGDCTEHADVFLAAARAAGWEVRPAAGWLYVAEPTPRLWLHAWAEVRVGERWVGVDPALGQFPADAGHLRVGEGTLDVARADGVDVTIRDLR